jgi:ribosomal protein S17
MKIEKKIWPLYFQKIIDGVKTYELRLADFECGDGDVLVLREWDPKTKEYTGRVVEKTITYVLKTKDQTFWSKEDVEKYGLQIIAFK